MGEQEEVATLPSASTVMDTAATALRRHLWRILARHELTDTTTAVRAATAAVASGARERLAAGDPYGAIGILEAGRGLALFAATEMRPVADHLDLAGKADLARQWRAAATVGDPQKLPADLRRDVLTALRAHSSAAALLTPPSLGEIQETLAADGADALVYLIPGHAVIAPADGPVVDLPLPSLRSGTGQVERFRDALGRRSTAASHPAGGQRRPGGWDAVGAVFERMCAWAWDVAIGPLVERFGWSDRSRPARVILVPVGDLARVPWHAARSRDGVYAVELLALSYAVSARMMCRSASLPPIPSTGAALVMADPHTGVAALDLTSCRREAYEVKRVCYPSGRFVGRLPSSASGAEKADGKGTVAQLWAWLTTTNPSAGETLHLACTAVGRSQSYLMLAGGETLSSRDILTLQSRALRRPIDLVVLAAGGAGLPPAGTDEAYGLSTAFLAAGIRSVIAARWEAAPALMFLVHHFRKSGHPAWSALREAQLWMLDPDRKLPYGMPPDLATDDFGPSGWAAVSCWG